jgi:hypothetical protein
MAEGATYGGAGLAAWKIRRIGSLDDLPGGGQVAVRGRHAYVGHMNPPDGTSIIDIDDPRNPKVVGRVPLATNASHTHKVRVEGDLMVVNVEQADRHFRRKAAGLAAAETALRARLGRAPDDAGLAAHLGIPPGRLAELRHWAANPYEEGGFRVYDIRDRTAPRLLCHQRTGGLGVHRFDFDGRHAYISTEMDGYVGNILVVYDLADPGKPQEVGRWHLPGQHVAAGEKPSWPGLKHRLHHAMRFGDELWAAFWYAGVRVLDARNLGELKVLGAWDHPAAFPEPTHTVCPLPERVNGRRYAVSIDEEHDHRHGQPHAFLWVLDVTDMTRIEAVAVFDPGQSASAFSMVGDRFGAHQFAERIRGSLVHCTWFSGGLRVVDLSDPLLPREVAHFVPEPRGGTRAPQSNDVDIDDRGLIHMIDRRIGYDILEHQG